ncbi:hypothetical protein [Halorubrum sp. 2020YC2]|uniref:hypothetical protein n=1 Tax=Halorubrum sp. 2020YC2 TaxID=2836432 RepID=UPI001BED3A6B|nr:hypothetical protein [Halorubrum sp. 2020YC2]QWC20146.1 hypothetical protein KI388_04095 [Halorubrum sp. 2020YC2]
MGLIDAVRAWLFGADDDAADAAESDDETEASEAAGGGESAVDDDGSEGLDPAAATETRTATATDDAVDALRDVRESGPPVDGDGETGNGEADDDDGAPERPTDGDRGKR